jgi:integrase
LSAWRIGQVRGLLRTDVEGNVITLPGERSKSKEARTLPLTGELLEIVHRALANGSSRVFTRANGKPVGDFRKVWKKAAAAAGFPNLATQRNPRFGPHAGRFAKDRYEHLGA